MLWQKNAIAGDTAEKNVEVVQRLSAIITYPAEVFAFKFAFDLRFKSYPDYENCPILGAFFKNKKT